ncbi:14917_t:CDS:1, partial [Cetraspora pellucida]
METHRNLVMLLSFIKIYVKKLISQGINLCMTEISPIISQSWRYESEYVKQKYREIAEIAKIRHKECWPNPKC